MTNTSACGACVRVFSSLSLMKLNSRGPCCKCPHNANSLFSTVLRTTGFFLVFLVSSFKLFSLGVVLVRCLHFISLCVCMREMQIVGFCFNHKKHIQIKQTVRIFHHTLLTRKHFRAHTFTHAHFPVHTHSHMHINVHTFTLNFTVSTYLQSRT